MNILISRWKHAVKEANVTVDQLQRDYNLTNSLLDTLAGILDETDAQATRRGSHILNIPSMMESEEKDPKKDGAVGGGQQLDIIKEDTEDVDGEKGGAEREEELER